jgi:cytochrome oxidase Cu insertion factor (SCO1/SenC/PrrC family)
MIRPLLVVLVAMSLAACYRGPGPMSPDPGTEVMTIPSFTLTDQTGAERTELIFRRPGVTVLAFTFTSCPLVCPLMNNQMLRLQRETEGLPVHSVSISVDPERDTPEKLAEHAEAIGADTDRWTFLTGDYETVERISEKGLKLALGSDGAIDLDLPQEELNAMHSRRFVLVRSDGRPIAMYDGDDPEEVDRLIARIKAAF